MVMPPVLHRELRAAARNWSTYWLRVIAGLGISLLLLGVLIGETVRWGGAGGLPSGFLGGILLAGFHSGLMLFFAFACPVATADTLARERREGTLGLLFLTTLTPLDVVVGKTVAHVLRMFALWMAMLPFLAIPFLLGGVGPADFGRALGAEFSIVLAGLAAGFMATSRARTWLGAVGVAAIWMIGFLMLLAMVCLVCFLTVAHLRSPATPIPWEAWPAIPFGIAFASTGAGAVQSAGAVMGAVPGWVLEGANVGVCGMMVVAVGIFGMSAWLAAHLLNNQQQHERHGVGQRPERVLTLKDERRRFRKRRWLDINPVLWLESIGPALSWLRLGLPVLVILVFLLSLWGRSEDRDFEYVMMFVSPALLMVQALLAAGSFRREIEEGTFEILLVTPLPPESLVSGRRWALIVGMGPGLILSELLILLGKDQVETWEWSLHASLVFSTWLTLPWVGIRCAMRRLHPIPGWVLTVAWGALAPAMLGGFGAGWLSSMGFVRGGDERAAFWFGLCAVLAQWAAALWWGRMTEWDLRTRAYQRRPLART
jgi:ABC-type transport system involved in multi-copper enzyme maturation permease subunit